MESGCEGGNGNYPAGHSMKEQKSCPPAIVSWSWEIRLGMLKPVKVEEGQRQIEEHSRQKRTIVSGSYSILGFEEFLEMF